jgi:hypothetical protein
VVDPDPSAAALLRAARRKAGITQVELARRAGVQQSVISDYERGQREPSLATLSRLVRAAGLRLEPRLREPARSSKTLAGPLGRRIVERRSRIRSTARTHGVRGLAVFGSVARGEESAGSDVDMLIDLPAEMGLLGLARLQRDLEEIIGAPVDLVPSDGLKPAVRARVSRELVAI